jgi:hypothetical protein
MNLISDTVDLCQQALQIDSAAGSGPGDDEFHGKLSVAVVSDQGQLSVAGGNRFVSPS